MKVLFAVSNEEISEQIVKKYQKEYKEIISFKNVYYFNAILKELQKDKTYDRIVISEDLETFTSTQYDQIDKFIFEKLDSISDEASNIRGNDIPIILIGADRRAKGEAILVKLFGIGIYDALIGKDRSFDEVCKLIYKPRSKKEAKIYYKIDSDDVNYQAENENDVSEMEIQNIVAHYKRLGSNEEKYVDSFSNIAAQYNDTQLRVITQFLPVNVRAVLEEKSEKYQQIMSFNNSVSDSLRYSTKKEQSTGPSETLLNQVTKDKQITEPIVIPSSVNLQGSKKLLRKKPKEIQNQQNITNNSQDSFEQEENIQTQPTTVNQFEEEQINIGSELENNIFQDEENKEQKNIINPEIQKEQTPIPATEGIVEPVKRGRGRPRKNPVVTDENATKPVKRGRGRPRTNPIQAPVLPEEEQNILPEFEPKVEQNILPGFENEEENMLPGFGEEENTLPGFGKEENALPGFGEEENTLPGFGKEENALPGFGEEENTLPGFGEEENTLPGFEKEENVLPGFEEQQNIMPGFETPEEVFPGMFNNTEDTQFNTKLPEFENTPKENTNINQSQTLKEDNYENTTINSQANPQSYNNNYNNYDNIYNHNIGEATQHQSNKDLSYLLTPDKKIATFVGTSKNGTSFIVNNIAEYISSVMGINTAILDTTQNRNSYYIYTKNEDKLRDIASRSIEGLARGTAQGIKVNKNLTVYTSLPNEEDLINYTDEILETLVRNYSLVLIDTDFNTPLGYFKQTQDLYLVQSLDILTMQPLTAFLRELKAKNILDEQKLRIILNKVVKIRGITDKTIIGGMAFYKDPAMSFMTELFDRNTIKYISIPFEEQIYTKYLQGVIDNEVSLKGYSKSFGQTLGQLAKMVYPIPNMKNNIPPYSDNKRGNNFSPNMNNTLDQMRKKI